MQAARRLLVAAVRDDEPLPALTPPSWRHIPSLAALHGLSPRLNALLSTTAAPADVRRAVRSDTLSALAGQLQVQADLRLLGPLMDATGVAWAAVKGPVLADHWYAARGQRSFVDLDLVVDPTGFDVVLDALEYGGAVLVDRNWTYALAQQRAEISLRLPHGTALDLHWHVLNTPALRAAMPLRTSEVLARTERVRLSGTEVPTFDPADTLLHLCLHTTLSGGQKLAWYRDLQQVATRGEMPWDEVVERTTRASAGLPVAVALRRARQLAGAAVPLHLENRVAPRGRTWQGLVRALDITSPPGQSTDRRLSGQLLVEASRHDTRQSCDALRTSVLNDLLKPVLHDPQHPWRRRGHAGPPAASNPLWSEPTDRADRDRYLRFVTTQDA